MEQSRPPALLLSCFITETVNMVFLISHQGRRAAAAPEAEREALPVQSRSLHPPHVPLSSPGCQQPWGPTPVRRRVPLRRRLETSAQPGNEEAVIHTASLALFPQTGRLENTEHVPEQLQPCPMEPEPGLCGRGSQKPPLPGSLAWMSSAAQPTRTSLPEMTKKK